ncbi:MAG: glycosyltransferase [Verrucomicrobiae bacterium]|nr:glycosyltransferase [Verrucomicrobiae bacterium]
MQAIHVVAGLGRLEGGPSNTLPKLWSHLKTQGVDVSAFTTVTGREKPSELPAIRDGIVLNKTRRIFPRRFKFSPELGQMLRREMPKADLCHNHGCWLHPNWLAARVARSCKKPLIISPLGHLDPWSLERHAWAKKILRLLVEERHWFYASAFVAKSEVEAENLRHLGLKQTIRVIPNGIDVEDWKKPVSSELFFERFPELLNHQLALFLSRLHPKKGIISLLKTWEKVSARHPDWCLVLAGGGDEVYVRKLRHWVDNSGCAGQVAFVGELDWFLKRAVFVAASFFVLPSHSENFGQVILESLASGTPVIASRGCPWPELEKRGCGWWMENTEAALEHALETSIGCPPVELRAMGARGREWALRDFDWKQIAGRMRDLYQEVLGH